MSTTDNPLSFTHLNEWLAWLEQAHSIHKIELGLERVTLVARDMGLLKPQTPVITVAGTNGKGTTVAAIEALAVSHKLSVGTYTSPHLIDFNERIKLDGENCSDEWIIKGFQTVYQAKDATELSYFEYTTLVALWIYSQHQLDLIVLEVGLGGRLDAVNIIDADIAVITSIGLDHIDWLGSDLKGIAKEKVGIARAGKPLVMADPAVEALLQDSCQIIGCKPVVAERDYASELDRKYWSYHSTALDIDFHELPLNDLYYQNLAAGLTAFSLFYHNLCGQQCSKQLSYAATYKAFEKVELMGRFQTLSETPHIIVDVAHNVDSAELLNQKLKMLKDSGVGKVIALCGMLKDKDTSGSLELMTAVDQWHLLDLDEPRGKKSGELLQNLPQLSQNGAKCYASLAEFSEDFRLEVNDTLVVFGSFVTVGLFIDSWNKEGFVWI